jgi:hypothetical protein
VSHRSHKVLDAATLTRRSVVVLELDVPTPVFGIVVGMPMDLVLRDGSRTRVELKSIGFASSTPEHAHIIVNLPPHAEVSQIERVEFEERHSPASKAPPSK